MSLAASAFAPLRPELRILWATELPSCVEPLGLLTPLEGDLVARAAGEAFPLRSGELLVLRRGHALEIEGADARARVAHFRASLDWVDAFYALFGMEPHEPARELERLPASAALARRAAQLLSLGGPPGTSCQAGTPPAATLVTALLEIALQARGLPLARRTRASPAERRAALVGALADYDPEADADFSLRGLAERVGLCTRQTARLVRGETGHSFRELKAAARIERAQKLLASSELSLLEVALRAGWNSVSQFHDAFRRCVGVTPARYRATHRG